MRKTKMSNQTEQLEKSNEKAKNKTKLTIYKYADINHSVKRGRGCKKHQSEA
jgi:hypothetical protein